MLLDIIEFSLTGLSVGALYALTGIGFVVVYKATRVINFAIGEFMMLGAYLFFGLTAGVALPVWAAIPLAIAATGVAGGLIERLIFRRMLGEHRQEWSSHVRGIVWLRPELVGKVEFRGWTSAGLLRAASFKGLREDNDPLEVRREDS
jgi:hypothetical protein